MHPAYEYIKAALSAGKNVVTANKAVIAAFYPELSETAKANGVSLLFSASAGGGIPWLKNLARAKEVDELLSLRGVMNGTTNYILDKMTGENQDYGTALKEAQEAGFAEADPSSDVEGLDTRRKLAVSLLAGFGIFADETSIPAFGITGIRPEDIAAAEKAGAVIKLVGFAEASGDKLSAYVVPVFVPANDLIATLHGADNAFSYTAKALGTQCFTGAGAGRYPTATNVIRDLKDLASAAGPVPAVPFREGRIENAGTFRFYVRENETAKIITSSINEMRDAYEGKQGVFIALLP